MTHGPGVRCPAQGRTGPLPQGFRPAGRYFGGKRIDKEERDGRSRSHAQGKFLLRGKYFHSGFPMTAVGSFLHNHLWEKTWPEKPPSPTSSHCLEVSRGRRFSCQPLPRTARANERQGFLLTLERKENEIYLHGFSDRAPDRQGSAAPFLPPALGRAAPCPARSL